MLSQSLWGDESFSAMAVQKSFSEMLGVVARDTAPPGYYVASWLWVRVFGFSEIGIRSMSTLMMIVMAIYAGFLVKELFKDRWGAWMTGVAVFFAPFLFDFAFEGRMYAILGMFCMMSTYYFVRRNWPAYSLTAALTLYAQHFGVFLIFSHFLWFGVENWKDWVKIWKKREVGGLVKKLSPFLMMFYVYLSGVRFLNPEKRDFRSLAGMIKKEMRSDDELVNYNGRAHHLWESKYYGVGAPIWSPGGPLPYWVGTAQMEESDVIYELPESKGRLGVISSNSMEDTILPKEWKMESYEERRVLKIIWYRREEGVE